MIHTAPHRKATAEEDGTMLIEFSMCALLAFIILLFGIDLARICYASHVSLFVANEIGRSAAVGAISCSAHPSPSSPTQRAACIIANSQSIGKRFGLDLRASDIRVCPLTITSATGTCTTNSTGDSNRYFVVVVEHPVEILFQAFSFTITSASVMRNESI